MRPVLRVLSTPALALALAGAAADAGELADPTRPEWRAQAAPAPEPAAPVAWTLTLVKIRGDARSAVLNGERVHEGDRIAGARVKRILPSSVLLETGHGEARVRLAGASIKLPADAGPGSGPVTGEGRRKDEQG